MKEGMLWFDNTPNRELIDKINRAVDHYQTKLKQKPTVCYVNADQFESDLEALDGVYLKPAPNVLPHHFWIGVEQTKVTV